MRMEIEELVDSIINEINVFIEQSKQFQIREMLKREGKIKTYNGNIVFDIPLIDMDYAINSDNIINRINEMEMKEEITEEESGYIKYKTHLL